MSNYLLHHANISCELHAIVVAVLRCSCRRLEVVDVELDAQSDRVDRELLVVPYEYTRVSSVIYRLSRYIYIYIPTLHLWWNYRQYYHRIWPHACK